MNQATELKWQLRVSPRARYAKLQIKPYGGLEVVIPKGFPRRDIPHLVEKHAAWARRQIDKQARLRDAVRLPPSLDLAFDGSSTPIIYPAVSLEHNLDMFSELAARRIVIDAADRIGQIRELQAWIRGRAKALLPPLLTQLSAQTGLGFQRISIRSQKTRWGSCSNRGHINLNDQLMFVPPDTAAYLMIHELCHTRHLNHSARFWQLVARHCADYRRHEALLSDSRNLVPDWFLLGLYTS